MQQNKDQQDDKVDYQEKVSNKEMQKKDENNQIQVFDREANELKILEGISPLAIKSNKFMKIYNESKTNLDENNLEYNINPVTKDEDLTPKQVESIKANEKNIKGRIKIIMQVHA